MLDGPTVVEALKRSGITHVIWIPDSDLGTWENALRSSPGLELIRVCREGEAIAIAAGLLLGGQRPIVMVQCTGFFEAGDALRNIVHDMKLPLFLLIGIRGYLAYQRGARGDTCPVFAEPILKTWQLPYIMLDRNGSGSDLAAAYQQAWKDQRSACALLPE
jgi:sulfopyruvate decarboxylase TPP-binding subunit